MFLRTMWNADSCWEMHRRVAGSRGSYGEEAQTRIPRIIGSGPSGNDFGLCPRDSIESFQTFKKKNHKVLSHIVKP